MSTPLEHLRLLAEQAREHALILVAPDGLITWWNSGAEYVFGVPASEAVGQPVATLFTPEDVAARYPGT